MRHSRIRIVSPLDLASMPEVVTPFRPIILDYDAARSHWFAISVNDRACEDTDPSQMDPQGRASFRPNYEYRMIDGDWRSVEIGSERLGSEANLLVTRRAIDQNTLVSLAAKAKLNSTTALPSQFRRIVAYVEC